MRTGATLLALLLASAPSGRVAVPGGVLRPTFPPTPDEKQLRVAGFRVDRTPVTNAQYLAFVRAQPQWQRGRAAALFVDDGYLSHWAGSTRLGAGALPQQPVTNVSWFAARAYCAWTGGRLPTWTEWEYVAAASATSADARTDPRWQQEILAWYASPQRGALPRVGRNAPNLYGVQDLHGLVWEWVEDFNSVLVSSDGREAGGADRMRFCGAGALSAQDRADYAVFMRVAFLGSLQARYTAASLGFRCADDKEGT
ncbi:MAG: formylglycine-generating enzyme family protein [Myxococcota bacterium]